MTTAEERERSKTWGFWEGKGTFFREWNDRLIAHVEELEGELEKAREALNEINTLSCGVPMSELLNEINTLTCQAVLATEVKP